MPNYRRLYVPGGSYFFTLVTENRAPLFKQETARALLRKALTDCQERWPFTMEALVLLHDHLHTIWTLPEKDDKYSTRWAWLKKEFTKGWLAAGGAEQPRSGSKVRNRRRGVWLRRFWEHTIKDDGDFERHADYIHYNPVKHGYVKNPVDWPFSTIHRWIKEGCYPRDWGQAEMTFDGLDVTAMELG